MELVSNLKLKHAGEPPPTRRNLVQGVAMGAAAFTPICFSAQIPLFSVSPSARTIGEHGWLSGAVGAAVHDIFS